MQSNESKQEVPLVERLQDELDILNADIKDLQEKARECRDAINQLKKTEKDAAKAAAKEAAEAVAEPKQKKQKAVYKDANKHLRDEDGVPLEFIERKNYLAEYNNKMIIDAIKQVGWRRVRKKYGGIIDDVFLYAKPKWHHLTTAEQIMENCVKGDDYFTTDYFTEKSLIDHLKIVVPQKRLAYLEKLSKK